MVNAVVVSQETGGYLVSFNLADVDMVQKRLAALEAGQSVLEDRQSATETGQDLQDGAIAELGEIVGGMMEGGEE